MEPNTTQWLFLRLFLTEDLDSVRVSLMAEGRSIGRVRDGFNWETNASHVQGYIKSGGENGPKGQAIDRRLISMADLRALDACWAIPLRELNDYGRALAMGRPKAKADQRRNFRLTQTQSDALDTEAERQGRDASELIRDALAAYLESRK